MQLRSCGAQGSEHASTPGVFTSQSPGWRIGSLGSPERRVSTMLAQRRAACAPRAHRSCFSPSSRPPLLHLRVPRPGSRVLSSRGEGPSGDEEAGPGPDKSTLKTLDSLLGSSNEEPAATGELEHDQAHVCMHARALHAVLPWASSSSYSSSSSSPPPRTAVDSNPSSSTPTCDRRESPGLGAPMVCPAKANRTTAAKRDEPGSAGAVHHERRCGCSAIGGCLLTLPSWVSPGLHRASI